MSLKGEWDGKEQGAERARAMRDAAEAAVRERDRRAEQHMIQTHERAMRLLDGERQQIVKEKDSQPHLQRHHAALFAATDRYMNQVYAQRDRDKKFGGRMVRLFGGKKLQEARIQKIEQRGRDVCSKLSNDYDRREMQRQRSLHERLRRIDADKQQRVQNHPKDMAQMRQQRAEGFEHAVKQEMHRMQHERKQSKGRKR